MAEQDKQPGGPAEPGQVIAPGTGQPVPAPSGVEPQAPEPLSADQANDIPEDRKQIYQTSFSNDALAAPEQTGNVSWTASEFVAHEKSAGWYGILILIAAVIAGVVYVATRDLISTAMVLVCAVAFGIYGGKKPRQLQYHLDTSGVTIGSKRYTYQMFRSFSVVPEGAFSSIVFMPLKRFAPLTTIYYAPEDESKILDILSDRLPFEEHKDAAIDSLMRRVRF